MNPSGNEKNNTLSFPKVSFRSKHFIGTDSIQTERYYTEVAVALNNNHFNCRQRQASSGKRSFQRYSKSIVLCVYRENIASSPISFHFDFPLLLNAGGLNERTRPPLFMFPWWLRTVRDIYETRNRNLHFGLIVCRLKPRRYTGPSERELTF